jgi:hypothetical protein
MRIATNKVGRLTTRLLPPSQALIVSIHDVSPHTRAECEEIYAQLRGLGLKTCSWLVVPDYHGQGHFRDDPDFCTWLCELADAGNEIVVHGYFHLRERRAGESLLDRFLTHHYTAGEGEFYDIDYAAAFERVTQAQADFLELGLQPEGFIAPAWLLSAEAEQALKDAGFQYTTRLREVRDLHSGREARSKHGSGTHVSQSLVWSTRSASRRVASLLWNRALFRRLADRPLLRIAIHPADLRHPRIWRQIRHCVRQGLEKRLPFTYERWIARQRTTQATTTA